MAKIFESEASNSYTDKKHCVDWKATHLYTYYAQIYGIKLYLAQAKKENREIKRKLN